MDSKALKKSPTWPFVGVFAVGMEGELDKHRERGDRQGWMAASPDELFQALLEQTGKASDLLMRALMTPPTVTPEVKAALLKHLIHTANFAMMVADSAGVLPAPNPDERLVTVTDAEKSASLTGRAVALAPMAILDELRLAIGANEGESILEALERYTFAVQLGCAMKLERHADNIRRNPPEGTFSGKEAEKIRAALIGGAAFLREGIPQGVTGEHAAQNAVALWKAEQTQAIKDGMVDVVLERWWEKFMGGLPSEQAKAELRQLLLEFEPVDMDAPLPLGAEGRRIVAEGLERQEGTPAEEASHALCVERGWTGGARP